RGIVQTSAGMINVQSKSFGMAQGSELNAGLGRVALDVTDDAYLTEIVSGYRGAGSAVSVEAGADANFDGSVAAVGDISVITGGRTVLSGSAAVSTSLGSISVDGGALKMINGATMMANVGRVVIDMHGDALVTGVYSGYQTAVVPNADGA